MLKSKTIDRVCSLALTVMLILTAVIWTGKAAAGRRRTIETGYEGLFDQTVVHAIDVEINDWDSFIASATSEEYTVCNVTIDGQKLSSAGIRAKGNTSLSSVATMGSEKYSFKIEFDHFVDGRLYNGLDKLSLNNLIYDATMMKDYLAYTLMGKMGVPSPLCSYAQITVNGEPWGLYLAVEGVEDGFLERNNMTAGELYKPDSMNFGGGRGNGRDFDIENFREKDSDDASGEANSVQTSESDASGMVFPGFGDGQGGFPSFGGQGSDENAGTGGFPSMPSGDFGGFGGGKSGVPSFGGQDSDENAGTGGFPSMPSGDFTLPDASGMPEGSAMPEGFEIPGGGERGGFAFGGFNFGLGSGDVKLAYIDDDPDSYTNIFDSAKTSISRKDKTRLISALKRLSEREDIENTVFTDEVIAYLAVHDFLQNSDSYTGMMVHNYYLYEEDGKLAILPWDYNLAFGGMNGSDGTTLVNSPIDSPVATSGTSDRPLIAWIFEDDEALALYHAVYGQFVTEIIESGWLKEEISRVAELIRPCVQSDVNSFYTVEEFDTAVETMQSYCALRGESVRGQLDGTIPSTTAGQRADSTALVDAGELDVSSMGSMGGGGAKGGFSRPDSLPFRGGSSSDRSMPGASADTAAESGMGGQAFSGGFDFSGVPGAGPVAEGTRDTGPENGTPEASEGGTVAADGEKTDGRESGTRVRPTGRSMPDGFAPQGNGMNNAISSEAWLLFGIFVLILLLAIVLIGKSPAHNR